MIVELKIVKVNLSTSLHLFIIYRSHLPTISKTNKVYCEIEEYIYHVVNYNDHQRPDSLSLPLMYFPRDLVFECVTCTCLFVYLSFVVIEEHFGFSVLGFCLITGIIICCAFSLRWGSPVGGVNPSGWNIWNDLHCGTKRVLSHSASHSKCSTPKD